MFTFCGDVRDQDPLVLVCPAQTRRQRKMELYELLGCSRQDDRLERILANEKEMPTEKAFGSCQESLHSSVPSTIGTGCVRVGADVLYVNYSAAGLSLCFEKHALAAIHLYNNAQVQLRPVRTS